MAVSYYLCKSWIHPAHLWSFSNTMLDACSPAPNKDVTAVVWPGKGELWKLLLPCRLGTTATELLA